MSAAHIWLTGFEPFGADTVNPSGEVVKALDGRCLGPVVVRGAVLPVQREAVRERVEAALGEPGRAAVLHLGLAGGARARIALERIGVNAMDYTLPDARGGGLWDEPCVPDGPAAYWSTLPLREILSELTAAGIPAALSYTAGTSLCNFTLYTTLHAIARRRLDARAGFIHLPYLPGMVAAHGAEEPSMDIPLMLRAVEIALGVIASRPEGPSRADQGPTRRA